MTAAGQRGGPRELSSRLLDYEGSAPIVGGERGGMRATRPNQTTAHRRR